MTTEAERRVPEHPGWQPWWVRMAQIGERGVLGMVTLIHPLKLWHDHLMPGRQSVTVNGLQISVGPDFWLRRWTRFPFYFESTNPSFRIDLVRRSDPESPLPSGGRRFYTIRADFEDGTSTYYSIETPELAVDEVRRFVWRNLYTAYPGQTKIVLTNGAGSTFGSLYSYNVGREDRLWLAILAVPFAAMVSGITLLVQRWFVG